MKGAKENVRVVCRVRPQNEMERERGSVCVKLTKTTISVNVDDCASPFTFDRVFGMESTQQQVFEDTAFHLIDDVLTGYNATIFAYGQTSSGKTFTMEGPDINNAEKRGIIPRTVDALFAGVRMAAESIEFTIKISYVEIYMEKIRDLLGTITII